MKTSSLLNVETKPRTYICCVVMGKLKQWKICFLEMDYEKSGHHFVVNRYGISVIAIMKKLQNVYYFVSMHHMEKFQIAEPLKQVLVSGF